MLSCMLEEEFTTNLPLESYLRPFSLLGFRNLGKTIACYLNSHDYAGDENIAIVDYCRHIVLIEELLKSYE
ncbi:acetylornithine deacetylase [Streptococcus pyogenes]|nr:acetylornithine deacetylase [Streptococcus pyogenes]